MSTKDKDQTKEQAAAEGTEEQTATDGATQQDTEQSAITEKDIVAEQQSTLARLKAQPTRRILIPFDTLNPNDLVVTVSVNGVTYAIPRGKSYDVPETIADIWEESYAKTMEAQRKIVLRENLELQIR